MDKPNEISVQELLNRLQELEMKVTFQEDTIENLSDMIAKQDKELSELWTANRILKQSFNEMKSGNEGDDPEPPPPHY